MKNPPPLMSRFFNKTLLGFLKKEFKQSLRDPRMRIILFVMPLIQMTLFGVAISNDVKNVRLALQAAPDDVVAQRVYQHALASGWFIPAKVEAQGAFTYIQNDKADAVLVAPEGGLSRSIERHEGKLQLLVNATNVLRAQSVESYIQSILSSSSLGVYSQGAPPPPIHLDVRILYNPTMETAVFMVPGVMCMLITVITIILTSMSLTKEKEVGTFEMLISAPVKPWEVILGKSLPFVVMGMSNIPLILGVAIFAFHVPMRGSLIALVFSSMVYISTTVSIGILISSVAKSQQQSMMGGFLFLFPAVQLSGMMFPIENMPVVMKAFAYMNPLTYFISVVRNIMLKGGDPSVIILDDSVLLIMACISIALSFRQFKTTLQ